MDKMYFRVIGPDKNINERFIEQMSNPRYAILNDFRTTIERKIDENAHINYVIFPDNLELEYEERVKWMEFISKNKVEWVRNIK